jgi:hypothetical protein
LLSSASALYESYYVHDFLDTPVKITAGLFGAGDLVLGSHALAQDVINRGEKIVPGCARCQIFK